MTTGTKMAAFIGALAVLFAAAFGVGRAIGPVREEPKQAHHGRSATESAGTSGEKGGHGSHSSAAPVGAAEGPGGLQVSNKGYTLALTSPSLPSGKNPLTFRILGPDGKPVTAYEREHDKDLHLIVVRRDMSGFQHVHPVLAKDGRWSVDVALTPGTWRVFADFKPAGQDEGLTLGTDLAVGGDYVPTPLPTPAKQAHVDGYTVTLDGALKPGTGTKLTLSVSKNERPVTDLQPYLGAYGHLVALRAGDLGYLHVHPDGEPGDGQTKAGPQIGFHATAPSRGSYRLFLDFKHDGVVRTAEFTVLADGAPHPIPAATSSGHADERHSH